MTFEELQSSLNELVHETVAFKRIAGNSVIIYFFGEPGDETVVSLFIGPTWRYERHGRIIVGSGDFAWDESDFKSKEEYDQTFDKMCDLSDDLEGAELIACQLDQTSSDLTVTFSGNQVVRYFVNSAFKETNWTYRNRPQRLTVYVSCLGIELEKPRK